MRTLNPLAAFWAGKRNLESQNITSAKPPLQETVTFQRSHSIEPTSTNPSDSFDSTESLLSNAKVHALLLAFMRAEKPSSISPIEVALVVYLVLRRAFDHPIIDSQLVLATNLGCDTRTVARAVKTLASPTINWISQSKRKRCSDRIALMHENLPLADEAERLQITQAAKSLSGLYQNALRNQLKRRRFPKNWLAQQHVSAQRILRLCGGDLDLARRMVSLALSVPCHKGAAKKSLYHIVRRWKKRQATHDA